MTIRLIHQTDFFRPHGDPDDHFDMACAFSLATRGHAELAGILCDFPPPRRQGDPDVMALSQLNWLTGMAVPMAIGMPQSPQHRNDTLPDADGTDLNGVAWLLKMLETSTEQVAITVVGSCKDVAVASKRAPELFREKCAAIYLNAGMGTPDPALTEKREFNVNLNPHSYAAMFDVPCPLYWMPCYDHLPVGEGDPRVVRPHGTLFTINQGEIFPHLSPALQQYFVNMLEHNPGPHWLRQLHADVSPESMERWCAQSRCLWSTASFFHLAGLGVTTDGTLLPLDEIGDNAVYRFQPIEVECPDDGRTRWQPATGETDRFKFEVLHTECYSAAMTRAITTWLQGLGTRITHTPPA